MSSALSEGPGRPGPGAAAGTVFRSELNPVDFLYRAAYLYPDKVAVVIPAYNESENIPRLLADLGPVARELGARVIFVDDGSSDGTSDCSFDLPMVGKKLQSARWVAQGASPAAQRSLSTTASL